MGFWVGSRLAPRSWRQTSRTFFGQARPHKPREPFSVKLVLAKQAGDGDPSRRHATGDDNHALDHVRDTEILPGLDLGC